MNLRTDLLIAGMFLIISNVALSAETAKSFREPSSQAASYNCQGYQLTIDGAGALTLKNIASNSSSALAVDGMSSGSSTKSLFAGALIPVGMNILARIEVAVQNSLIEGSEKGKIWVSTAADPSSAKSLNCTKQ